MIIAKLEDLYGQVPASELFEKALKYIQAARTQDLADGRYEIEADRLYALVQSYDTLPIDAAKYEAHQKYVDIQYIVSGREVMGWADLDCMEVQTPYQADKDVSTGTCPAVDATLVKVDAGQAAIFFPRDAHAPKLADGQPSWVKKIVVKVKVK